MGYFYVCLFVYFVFHMCGGDKILVYDYVLCKLGLNQIDFWNN